ncbi:uncharacterized protein LTR77_002245 [Saxophila tyrrhenica]|uniref:Uncharacterized protein n=1 Tax=Saxophila tyrrhenica TaxID=1690608 RepID=A0AAV9PI18_9PEZI|nr:hypothetical protein LTR77_002245 [Saxophila tyrrhenica]
MRSSLSKCLQHAALLSFVLPALVKGNQFYAFYADKLTSDGIESYHGIWPTDTFPDITDTGACIAQDSIIGNMEEGISYGCEEMAAFEMTVDSSWVNKCGLEDGDVLHFTPDVSGEWLDVKINDNELIMAACYPPDTCKVGQRSDDNVWETVDCPYPENDEENVDYLIYAQWRCEDAGDWIDPNNVDPPNTYFGIQC